MSNIGYIEKPEYLRKSSGNNSSVSYPVQRDFEFTFYSHHQLEFILYSIDKAKLQESKVSHNETKVSFSVKYFN